MVNMDKLKLRFAKEININGFKIKIPVVKQIINLGEKAFGEYTMPYALSKDIIQCDKDIQSQLRDFDLFFMMSSKDDYLLKHDDVPFLHILLDSLKFYFQEDVSLMTAKDLEYAGVVDLGYSDDILSSVYLILVENNGIIDRDNFDVIANTILEINGAKKMKIEPEPEFKNERQRDIYNKIMEGRRRKAEKETETIADMIDVVQFGGKSFISYDEIEKFTIQQLIHAYITILNIDGFNINFGQYQAGASPKDLDLDHWTKKIKQINSQ